MICEKQTTVLSKGKKGSAGENRANGGPEHLGRIFLLDRRSELLVFLLLLRDHGLGLDVARLSKFPHELVLGQTNEHLVVIVGVETATERCLIPTVKDALTIFIVLLAICFIVDVDHGEAALRNVGIREVLAWTQLIDALVAHGLVCMTIEVVLGVLVVPGSVAHESRVVAHRFLTIEEFDLCVLSISYSRLAPNRVRRR